MKDSIYTTTLTYTTKINKANATPTLISFQTLHCTTPETMIKAEK